MPRPIQFSTENTSFTLKNKTHVKNWVRNSILKEGKEQGPINFIFCNDEYLLKINQTYLNHDNYTDIITFDYTEGNTVSGDIFISIERVRENALKYQAAFDEELHRVIIHGILHLCGYKDKNKAEKSKMTQAENQYLSYLEHPQNK